MELYNPSNVEVDFAWSNDHNCFHIEPAAGVVAPRKTIACWVSYNPKVDESFSSQLVLSTEASLQQILYVNVICKPVKVVLSLESVKVENIPLNLLIERQIVMRNLGFEAMTFKVLNPHPVPGIRICPSSGVLNSFSDQVLDIMILIKNYIDFESTVQIELQKGQIVEFELLGYVELPNIAVHPQSLQLNKIPVGAIDRVKFLVENCGNSTAKLEFNFEDLDEFYVLESTDTTDKPVTSFHLESQDFKELWLHYAPIDVAPHRHHLPMVLNGMLGPPHLSAPITQNMSTYLTIPENSTDTEDVRFLEPPSKVLCVPISCSAFNPILEFSAKSFKFVSYLKGLDLVPQTTADLEVTNVSAESVEFCIRTDDLQGPFYLKPETGETIQTYASSYVCVLHPRGKITFKLEFSPTSAGKFKASVPIFVRDYIKGKVFTYINLKGTSHYPLLQIDEDKVFLLPVPIKVRTKKIITVLKMYHLPECKLVTRCSNNDLDVTLKQSQELDGDWVKQKIVISYYNKNPTLFETYVTILCNCSCSLTLCVQGGIINCCVTNYIFLEMFMKVMCTSQLPSPSFTMQVINISTVKRG